MDVLFRRTGPRRYAVALELGGQPPQVMDPAPGYDDHIPHDLVHYVVEAELGLASGLFGRAAQGGGTFRPDASSESSPRERARARRKQLRREASLGAADQKAQQEMESSERLAAISDLFWRRRQGQRPDPSRLAPTIHLTPEDATCVTRIVARLEELAPLWQALPLGGELAFTWPSVVPQVRERGQLGRKAG